MSASGPATGSATPAPLFNDLGDYKHSIATVSMDAQWYFNQG